VSVVLMCISGSRASE